MRQIKTLVSADSSSHKYLKGLANNRVFLNIKEKPTLPLSWNEIKSRAIAFSKKWEGETSERAESQSFWNDFFAIFGIDRKRVAFLFTLYQQYTSLLPADVPAKKKRRVHA